MKARHRTFGSIVVVALTGTVLLALLSTVLIRTVVRDNMAERVGAETALLAHWARSAPVDPQGFAEDAAASLGMRVTLIDAAGVVLADSAKDRAGVDLMENHLDRPEIQAAGSRGFGQSIRRSGTTNVEYLYSARRVAETGPVRFVRIAVPSSRLQRVQSRYAWFSALTGLGAMALFSLLAYAAVRRRSRPLEKLALDIQRSAAGDAVIHVPETAGEEVRGVALAAREAHLSLTAKLALLDAEREVLSWVVSGMREGVLLVEPDRRVRLANPAILRIFDLEFDPVGHLLTEVVRHPTVVGSVEAALDAETESAESSLTLHGPERSFELRTTPLIAETGGAPRGVLVILVDVTRTQALERVRREFVANVSHELRTPLSSIKAFVETLIDEACEDRANAMRFLQIVRKNADHMGELIADLTDLSLIETGAVSLELREVDAAEVAREVAERIRPSAAERDVEIHVDLPRSFPLIADRRRLEQMLTNLIDNAVKFNRPNGEVHVVGKRDAKKVRLAVEDSGVGVAAESLDKVFNRFYQVERQRSRERQGTGLGLAIVKHLMRLHGGSVSLSSELGAGARFTLEFPDDPAEAGSRRG